MSFWAGLWLGAAVGSLFGFLLFRSARNDTTELKG